MAIGYRPRLGRAKYLVCLRAYFDDSGKETESPLVVAGLVAEIEEWSKFSEKWQKILEKHEISASHMADLAAKQKEFKNWTKQQETELVLQLLNLLELHTQNYPAFGCVIDRTDFDTVKNDYKTIVYSAYLMACEQCSASVYKWSKKLPERENYALFFEKGDAFLKPESALADAQRLQGNIFIIPKKGIIPFQVADFVAYETYRYVKNLVDGQSRPVRQGFERFLKNKEYIELDYDQNKIKNHFEAELERRASL